MTYDFIENKTLREYYEKEGVELSDEAKAWFMYRVSGYERRWKYLHELAQSTTDLKLSEQISADYQRSVRAVEEFKNTNDDPTILYQYTAYDDTHSRSFIDDVRIFSSFDNTIEHAKSSFEGRKGFRFKISKLKPDSEYTISDAIFADTFELKDITPDMYMGDSTLYNTLPRVPIPYRRGDIVKFTQKNMDGYYGVLLDPGENIDEWYDYIEEDQGSMFQAEPCLWMDIVSTEYSDIYCHPEYMLCIERIDLDDVSNENDRSILTILSTLTKNSNGQSNAEIMAEIMKNTIGGFNK